MKSRTLSARRQRGFTLVEMSIAMAAAGLLFAAVTTGQELIDQAKATKLLNDVKSVEAQIQQFAQLKGRMPGDCDADGIVDYAADATTRLDTGNAARSNAYSYSVLLPTIPDDGANAVDENSACTLVSEADTAVTTNTTNANVWINDLKSAGLISDSVPNRTFAKLVNEDFMFVGSVTDGGGESADGADYNAIVIHNVPQWMARRLATGINGQDARADRSRVRLLNRSAADGTYDKRWQSMQAGTAGSDAMRDGMVTVVYFYDRVPESKVEADTTPG